MYNLRKIMTKAWEIFRKLKTITFGEALHRAWLREKVKGENESRVASAKAEAGVEEEVNTWTGWKALGYEVIHESKALFGCDLLYAEKGDGAIYKARFFGASQVQACA